MGTYAAEAERLMREASEVEWSPVEGSKIVEFFKGKNVFVTGATGFLGKLLVEKLLRACPDIEGVYVLIRPKKGEDEYRRVEKLYSDEVFGPLAKIFPKFQHKISIVQGDASLPNLGISPANLDLLKEKVNVIFHVAATVRFDEKMQLATVINVRGTRDLLNFARKCPRLDSFVHVSTAYANCVQDEVDEVLYKTPITADELIEMVETTPQSVLEERTRMLVGAWPNTYTFTKAIAEDVVNKYGKGLPVCVVRPAIVVATSREPLRSWIDNFNGATGIVLGAGTGLIKSIHCDENKAAEVVPGDYVINNMIAASYRTAVEKNIDKIPVYNYVSSVENRHTWKQFMDDCQRYGTELPTMKCVWYYCLTLQKYYSIHLIYSIFLHYLPALIIDFVSIILRKPPIMLKINRKITKFESVISHFCTNEWKFYTDNTQNLWKSLAGPDQKMFPFDIRNVDWTDFQKTHALGLKMYVLKDDLSQQPQAMRKWTMFFVAHNVIKALFYCGLLFLVYTIILKTVF